MTPELATKLASTFPLNSIVTIGNGIDPETFESFPPGEGPVPAFGQARRRIGIVGRLVPVKRVDLFIAAASQLARDPDFADVHFFILGDGPLRARPGRTGCTIERAGTFSWGYRSGTPLRRWPGRPGHVLRSRGHAHGRSRGHEPGLPCGSASGGGAHRPPQRGPLRLARHGSGRRRLCPRHRSRRSPTNRSALR